MNDRKQSGRFTTKMIEAALMVAFFMIVKFLVLYFAVYPRIKAASECLLNLLPTRKDRNESRN